MKTTTLEPDPQPVAPVVEKRREPRRSAAGRVTVETLRGPVRGQLLDVSDHGFRMLHADTTMETGIELAFAHAQAHGRARVMWNRILKQRVESGFLIVDRG